MSHYDGTSLEWEDRHVRSDNVIIGNIVYRPGGSCGPRLQRDYQLVILHSGGCELRLNDEANDLKVGHSHLLLPHREEHFLFSRQHKTHHSWCTVSPHAMPGKMAEQLRNAPAAVLCSETMSALLATAFGMAQPMGVQASEVIDLLALTIFQEYLRISDGIASPWGTNASVVQAVKYMEQHFPETDCLLRSHERADVSRNTLIKKFKDVFHATPDRYLWRLRTEKGIAMLLSTGLTVGEIAYRCGFRDQFHFSRKVSELQGTSPRELRRKAWLA